jgi:hypothetical protein
MKPWTKPNHETMDPNQSKPFDFQIAEAML